MKQEAWLLPSSSHKYIGNNRLYISSEHLAFISEIHYCGPLFLVAESSICLETGVVLAINNAAINRDIEKDKILAVWSKPIYGCVDFGFRVIPLCDSFSIMRETNKLIQHEEHIGRRM